MRRTYTEKWAVVYNDDGPSGPCGQEMSITSPWTNVWLFDSEEAAWEFASKTNLCNGGRRRQRVSVCEVSANQRTEGENGK
jgi:hypothetical protein